MLNQALINAVKIKLECLFIKWEWYGKKDQVLTVSYKRDFIIVYIELNITSPFSYCKYLVSFENFSCTGIEEKFIECSTIPANNNYDCVYDYQNGTQKYHYATIDCTPGIYTIPIMS